MIKNKKAKIRAKTVPKPNKEKLLYKKGQKARKRRIKSKMM